MRWRCGERALDLGRTVRLMGIVNVTPDSFSDGGAFDTCDSAIEHALALVEAGADIIDIGGESTRPGADSVGESMEMERVLPVIRGVRGRTEALISIDTTKAAVARAAIEAGADIINDVSALGADPEMASVAATSGAGLVLMHMRGEPRTMQCGDLASDDIVGEVVDLLSSRIDVARGAGVLAEAICVDPGIGFGKTVEQNLQLIDRTAALAALGCPVLVGPSRKSFLGVVCGRPVGERVFATAAACAWAVARGAHILRVHDVAAMRDVVVLGSALRAVRS